MSADTLRGAPLQVPTSVRWGGSGTQADVGATNCMYVFQIVDQNGDPINARQQVKVGACVCTTAAGTTVLGTQNSSLGPKVPTAAEIASSVLQAQANTVFVTAAGGAVVVQNGSTDDTGAYHLAGFIGAFGTMQSYIPVVGGGATYMESIFETDTQGRWSMSSVALADNRAIVITLANGKVFYFNNVRS